jgi:hypothetical protein
MTVLILTFTDIFQSAIGHLMRSLHKVHQMEAKLGCCVRLPILLHFYLENYVTHVQKFGMTVYTNLIMARYKPLKLLIKMLIMQETAHRSYSYTTTILNMFRHGTALHLTIYKAKQLTTTQHSVPVAEQHC